MNVKVFKPRNLVTIGEMSSSNLKHCQRYSSLTDEELSMVFYFDHVEVDFIKGNKWNIKNLNLLKLKKIVSYWQNGMHNQAWNALFWCNHDQPRIISRWGNEKNYRIKSAKLFAIVLHGLQGTPFIYQGEEIGMINPKFSCINDYKDIETINIYNIMKKKGYKKSDLLKIISHKSRDNSRTPMQWHPRKKYGGFTDHIPWIKMNDDFKNINVKDALNDKNSIFYTYKKILYLRKKIDVIKWGNYNDLTIHNKYLWCYLRSFNKEKLLVIANFSDKKQNFCLEKYFDMNWKILISNYENILSLKNMILRAYEAIWLFKN